MRAAASNPRVRRVLFPAAVAASLAAGALAFAQAPPGAAPDAVVARIADEALTVRDVQKAMSQWPPHALRAFGGSVAAVRRGLLDTLLAERVLARGAETEGLARLPEIRSLRQARLARALVASLRAELGDGSDLPTDELRRLYDANADRYQPERTLELWWIVVGSREEADRLLATMRSDPEYRKDPVQGWRELADKHSLDEATKHDRGRLDRVRADGTTAKPGVRVPVAVVQAAGKVQDGELVPEPIQDGDRWAVVQRRATQQGQPRSFESEVPNLRRALLQQRQQGQVQALLAKLREQQHVESYPERVDLLEVAPGESAAIVPAQRPGGLPRERRPAAGSPRPSGPPGVLR